MQESRMNPMDKLQIRDGRADEREQIQALTLAAYEQYAGLMPHWDLYREGLLATLAQDGPAERIVAERDGNLIGSVLLYPPSANVYSSDTADSGWPEMRLLAVAPAARGQGVGAALLDECMRRARQAGASFLGLHTEDIMGVAVRMYEGRGFVRVPEYDFNPVEGVLVKAYRRDLGAERSRAAESQG